MTGTHDIEMTVGLKIPDTTAITAFKALQRMGIKELKSLKRSQYYRFRVSGDPSRAAEQLGKTDIIVNANKNTFFTKPAGDPFPQEDSGLFTIRVLVKDMENNDRGLPQVMRERLGMGFIDSVETGVLWTMGFDAERERAWKVARDLGNRFFANLNYQEAKFLESTGGPQVLMLFGSQSDEPVYGRIADELDKEGVQHEMKVCSAHRSPKLLDRILDEYRPSVIIAGAGLAAHLPGVVASKTIRPVIGVPCDGNYQGLDAMLSIMQMPPGIPVLGVGVNRAHAAASAAALMMRDYETVNIIGDREHKRVKACSDILKQFGVLHEFSKDLKKDAINIRFFQMGDYSKPDTNALVINVPMTENNSAEDALRVLSMAKEGLWVGLNRGDNAAIAALQILAISGKHAKELEAQRKGMERKIEELYKPKDMKMTYKESGVDIDAAMESVNRIKGHVKRTFTPDVRMDIGKFGGAISAARLKSMEDPVLVSSIDGVGTKLIVARMMGKWDTVGKDIVNHSVGDIMTTGAEPMFFLDYIANEKMDPPVIEQIVKGMSEACMEANVAIIGGELAEMPGTYVKGERDIAGCIVGTVERSRMIDGSNIQEGDILIGLVSNGLHTSGYSLARKVLFGMAGYSVDDRPEELGGESVGEALMKPHTLYSKAVLPLLKQFDIRGIAHITGGGLVDNTPRIFPGGLSAMIRKGALPVPPIFTLIQKKGNVPEADMYRSFNMGVGMVLVAPQHQAQQIVQTINSSGLKSNLIGRMAKGDFGVKLE
jgi:phosphoribosylformylglycinamidine cyclo-ligase